MVKHADKKTRTRNIVLASVLTASVFCYVCIFALVGCPEFQSVNSGLPHQEVQDIRLPEVEIMKTVLERARDVFTIMSGKI